MTSFSQLQQYFLQHLNTNDASSQSLAVQPTFSEAKILLSREKRYWTYGPGDKVEGKLLLRNRRDLYCCGIRLDLEVIVSVKFRDSDLKTFHSSFEDVLHPKVFTYVWPINWSWIKISGKFTNERLVCLPASKHVFSFCFQYPSNLTLPGSFCSSYGTVRHQVVAYFQTPWDFIEIASCSLKFRDHYNLSMDPVALSPLTFEKQKNSVLHNLVRRFSSQKLAFSLKLPRQGLLPGHESPFLFTLNNQTGNRIEKILVSFIQVVCYHADKKKTKTVGAVLDFTETKEADWAVETIWESSLRIPFGVKPTYRGAIEHLYLIKVHVYLKGKRKAALKGRIPVIIGTTDNAHELHNLSRDASSESELLYTGHYSVSQRRRSVDLPPFQGASAKHRSKYGAPPPSYSQLPSRASSIDTFPPLYDEVMQNSLFANASAEVLPSHSAASSTSSVNPAPQPSSPSPTIEASLSS